MAEAPGAGANNVLRFIGVLELVASALVAIWLLSEFGSTWDPVTRREVSSPLGAILAGAVVVQALVIAALFFALAGMGDNLIAIRDNTASPAAGPSSGAVPAGEQTGRTVRCPNCHNEFAVPAGAETVECTKCGTRLRVGA